MFPLQAPVPPSAVATRSSTEVEAVASGAWGTVVRGDLQATASSKKAASSLSIGRPQYHAGGYFDGVRRKGRAASGARVAARPEGEKQGGPLLRGKAEPTFSRGQAGGGVDDRTAHLPVPDGSSGDRAGSGHDGGQVPGFLELRSLRIDEILRSRKRLRRQLLENRTLRPLRVAVLGGTTTNELVDLLELLLLADGFRPAFRQSEYNRFYEDATVDIGNLVDFKPDLVYLHTHFLNVSRYPSAGFTEADLQARVSDELERFTSIWESIEKNLHCPVIQNNFEHPPFPAMGNLDSTAPGGHTRFVNELNLAFAKCASADRRLLVHDVNSLSARMGHGRWFDWERWYAYKILTTPEASLELATSLASLVGAMLGRAKKCLVLDLDNTLWGGVIGDDGVDKLQIGKETPLGEAYTAFQRYCLSLRERGVLLAVCSKNDPQVARSGFDHPDSILKLSHFSSFQASWDPSCGRSCRWSRSPRSARRWRPSRATSRPAATSRWSRFPRRTWRARKRTRPTRREALCNRGSRITGNISIRCRW